MTTQAITATLPARPAKPDGEHNNAYNHSPQKEETDRRVLVAYDAQEGPGSIRECVDARWYMGRPPSSSVVVCSVWVRTRDGRHLGGQGRARGYGYCKASAAFDEACRSMGIKLSVDAHGAGMSVVEDCMRAIADASGYSDCPQAIV